MTGSSKAIFIILMIIGIQLSALGCTLIIQDAIRDSAPRIIITVREKDGETFTCQTESGHVVVTDEGGAEQLKDCE